MTSVFVVAKLMRKVIKACAATVFLHLRLRDCTNNMDIGRQDRIRLNITKSNAY